MNQHGISIGELIGQELDGFAAEHLHVEPEQVASGQKPQVLLDIAHETEMVSDPAMVKERRPRKAKAWFAALTGSGADQAVVLFGGADLAGDNFACGQAVVWPVKRWMVKYVDIIKARGEELTMERRRIKRDFVGRRVATRATLVMSLDKGLVGGKWLLLTERQAERIYEGEPLLLERLFSTGSLS